MNYSDSGLLTKKVTDQLTLIMVFKFFILNLFIYILYVYISYVFVKLIA